MDTVVSSPQSIQALNSALVEEYKASQQAASSAQPAVVPKAGQPSFASTLERIEKKELPAPTALAKSPVTQSVASKQVAASSSPAQPSSSSSNITARESEPGVATETSSVDECADPKISRSSRMQCAEKATHVEYQDDDFGFEDVVDLINPLQHIPVVGSIYRALTGDEINPEVQVAGSIAFGSATGSVVLSTISGIASAAIEQHTGEEPTIQVAEAIFGEGFMGSSDPLTEEKIVVADAAEQSTNKAPSSEASPVTAPAPEKAPVIKVAQAVDVSPVVTVTESKTTESAATTATAMPGLMASAGGVRVGNTIYTSPMMRSAAQVSMKAKVQPAVAAEVKPQQADQTAQTTTIADETKAAASNADTTLGALIHQQAKAREEGQQLPPQLVQDMMLKALDKYKTAHVSGGSSYATVH